MLGHKEYLRDNLGLSSPVAKGPEHPELLEEETEGSEDQAAESPASGVGCLDSFTKAKQAAALRGKQASFSTATSSSQS